MKRIKTSMFTLILASASVFAYAQDMGPQHPAPAPAYDESADEANPFANALDSDIAVVVSDGRSDPNITAFLQKKGWDRGLNDDGRYVGVGSSTVLGTTQDQNYNKNRLIAFNKAMLDLKASIVESFTTNVSTLAESILTSPNSSQDVSIWAAEAQVDPSFLAELTSAAKERVDVIMTNGEIATREEAAKLVISAESFRSLVSAYAIERVGGLIVSKIFEEDTKISIIAYYSPNTMALASVLNGTHSDFNVAVNNGVQPAEWVASLKNSEIYPCLGVFATSDREGNLVLLSFGQAMARSANPTSLKAAYEGANLSALGYLRNFAGELVYKSSNAFSSQAMGEFKEGKEISINEDSINSTIKAYSDELAITGANTVREWSLRDPRNGQTVCGVVKMWSIKTAQYASSDRDSMNESTQNNGGYLSAYPEEGDANASGHGYGNEPAMQKSPPPAYERTRISSPETQDF